MDEHITESLVEALRQHAEKVRTQAAFLALKQSELRPDDEMSFFGHQQAREELTLEAGLLKGHLLMIQQEIRQTHRAVNADLRKALNQAETVLNTIAF
jgi:hypothetical protein